MSSRIPYSLTGRDLEILETLTLKVRFLSIAQVARTWWAETSNSEANARERLKVLEQAGLIARFTAMAHPELEITSPIAIWEPGNALLNFGAVSYQLKSRWTKPPIATPAVIATKGAGHRFGGRGGRYPRLTEQTHDLHMAAVFLHFKAYTPKAAQTWISEELIRRRQQKRFGEKLPDAIIRTGHRERVIEFGGAYSKEKLIEFHEHCQERAIAYEVW